MKKEYINEAILNAEKSNLKVSNHGAVVVYRGKIVGTGYNKYSVIENKLNNKWSVHAEVDAINNALRNITKNELKKSILIVVRKIKDPENIRTKKTVSNNLQCEEVGLSTPCKCCANFINKMGLKKCYYS